MPACFALSDVVIGNETMALFAAFGALSTLLFVDFGGPMRARVTAQALLVVTAAALVTLGTLASQTAGPVPPWARSAGLRSRIGSSQNAWSTARTSTREAVVTPVGR